MDLRDASLGFYRTWHAALGARHGLFLALRDAALAPATVAEELGLDAEAVARWCAGAEALGLLARDKRGRYRLPAEHHDTLGEPTSAAYLGHHFNYLATKSLTFDALDDALRGRRARLDLAGTYAIATSWDHVAFFDLYLPRAPSLRRRLVEGVDVLDLGAGEGGWTREAARRFPESRIVAADRRARTIRGLRIRDARKVPRAAFDLVFMGEVLAATADPGDVLATAHGALRAGGQLVALEGLAPPPERAARTWGEKLVRAMALDFALDGSRFLTRDEATSHLKDAGFRNVRARDLGGSLFALSARA